MNNTKNYFLLTLFIFSLLFISCKKDNTVEPENENTTTYLNDSLKIEDVVLYELFVRNFTTEGTFKAIIPRLDELKGLGINTIWLMPIHPIGKVKRIGTYGSPYAVKDYFAVNPDMGTADDFKLLVNEAHKRGLLIIIDWVANHTAWDNNWINEHNDWYSKDSQGNIIPPIPDWQDVADLNYDNSALRDEMIKAMMFWVKEFNIDGFRCDAADMVPNSFWKEANSKIKALKPVFMLAETENNTLFNTGFHANYSWEGYTGVKGVFTGTTSSIFVNDYLYELKSLPQGALRTRFTTNHDETSWDKTPPEIFGGIDGAKAASVITIGLKGIPLIYNGQEVGSTVHQNLFEKSAINWNVNAEMKNFYSKLFNIYNNNPEFKYGTSEEVSVSASVVSYKRSYLNKTIWVIVNISKSATSINIPDDMRTLNFTNLFNDEKLSNLQSLNLTGYGFYILKY